MALVLAPGSNDGAPGFAYRLTMEWIVIGAVALALLYGTILLLVWMVKRMPP